MRIGLVLCVLMLSACVFGGGQRGKEASPAANPITGAAIATTSLDTPTQANPSQPAALSPLSAKPAAITPTATVPSNAEPAAASEEIAKPIPATTPQPVPQSPAEVTCVKSGGVWSDAGKSGAKTCVRRTQDSGKSCTKQTQCEGVCLSRSNTCAPVTPLFGCNDILQADGRQVTLCID